MDAHLREDSCGQLLKALDSGLTLLSLWWLMSLRSRFQVCEEVSYPKAMLMGVSRHSNPSQLYRFSR
jgi:hypothetical protein